MSLTRRGYAVGGICLLAFALGTLFGARALNAVVVPGLVALVVGWVAMYRTTPPTVTRSQPSPGLPEETRTVSLSIKAEQASSATVRERASGGLSVPAEAIETGLPGRVEYDCRLEARGERTLGPALLTLTDALGLFEREFRAARRTDVLVYPPVRPLSDRARLTLLAGEDPLVDDRGEFDSLREYVPGDPLRNVDWKASAKREELVVSEFAAREEKDGISIVAEAAPGRADAMATAAASVALWLLDAGVGIDLATPGGRLSNVSPGEGEEVLVLLARAGGGRVGNARRNAADVLVRAETDGSTITTSEKTIPFDRLVRSDSRPGDVSIGTPRAEARSGLDGEGRAATDGGFEGEL
jgi:uncharacterized protein (DUF58 family)